MLDQFRTKSMTGLGDGIETPNIDRIREKAIFFPKAACTSPLCTPSRASLATGKMPSRCGVLVHDANLPKEQTTYYQLLRNAGYRVAVFGKTDLHKMDKTLGKNEPLPIAYELGFTDPHGESEGKMNSAWFPKGDDGMPVPTGPYQRFLRERAPEKLIELQKSYIDLLLNKPKYHAEPSVFDNDCEHIDNFVGDIACDYLEKIDDETPWHIFVSFPGPHNPWDPPKSEVNALGSKAYPETPKDNLDGKPNWIRERAEKQSRGLTPSLLNNTKLHYDAAVQTIDKQVGKLLDMVEKRGLSDNTIIIFAADHGELLGDHGLFEKTAMYEGAVRVPLLISLPHMESRCESAELASLMDVAPTILELCGVDYNKNEMDAVSLVPIIQGKKGLRQVQQSELRHTVMLFDGKYKWIRSLNDSDELYDLDADPNELYNIIGEKPDVIKALKKFTFKQ